MALLLDPAEPEVAAAIESTREILERLGAQPYLYRLDEATAASKAATSYRTPATTEVAVSDQAGVDQQPSRVPSRDDGSGSRGRDPRRLGASIRASGGCAGHSCGGWVARPRWRLCSRSRWSLIWWPWS